MAKNSYLKNNLIVTSFNLFFLVANFVLQLITAYYFGTGIERDAYFAAVIIPTYISSVFIGSFGVIFLPQLIKNDVDSIQKQGIFISRILNNVLIILSIVSFFGVLFAKSLLLLTVPGFNESELAIASGLLRILFPTIIFQSGINIISSVLQSQNNFSRPAVAPLISVITAFVFIVLLNSIIGIKSLAVGTLIGFIFSFFYLIWGIKGFYRFTFNITEEAFIKIIRISLPLFLSGLISRAITLFERMIASTLPDGSISLLGYANQIILILSSITIGGISTTIFPVISSAWAENDLVKTRKYYENGIRVILFLTVPIAFLLFSQGEQLVQVVYERGKFDHKTTVAVSLILYYLTIAFISNSLGAIVSKIFYLSGRTVVSSAFEVGVTLVYIGLSFFLVSSFSYLGLAIASSIGALISVLVSSVLAFRILNGFNVIYILKGLAIIIICSGSTFLLIERLQFDWLRNGNVILITFIKCATFVILFSVFSYFCRLQETNMLYIQLKEILLKAIRNGSVKKA